MMQVCAGKPPKVGNRVLVIGAGFTAFDCARSALRLGAQDVTICLRRTEEDLVVTKDEVIETKTEGVKIASLMLSRRILGKERVEGVEFVRTRPGEKRGKGKGEVVAIEGSEFVSLQTLSSWPQANGLSRFAWRREKGEKKC
jgi:formate dehydrogenase major subunit